MKMLGDLPAPVFRLTRILYYYKSFVFYIAFNRNLDNHQSTGGRSERTQSLVKLLPENSFSYTCTGALHSFLSFTHCRATFTVVPLLPKATFASSIQPNLGLPRTLPPLTSAINTLLAIGYLSVVKFRLFIFGLGTCPNHLNTL